MFGSYVQSIMTAMFGLQRTKFCTLFFSPFIVSITIFLLCAFLYTQYVDSRCLMMGYWHTIPFRIHNAFSSFFGAIGFALMTFINCYKLSTPQTLPLKKMMTRYCHHQHRFKKWKETNKTMWLSVLTAVSGYFFLSLLNLSSWLCSLGFLFGLVLQQWVCWYWDDLLLLIRYS
jgi:hypothetical protein